MGRQIEPQEIRKTAKEMLDAIDSTLRDHFDRCRKLTYNPITKGYDYEKSLSDFLMRYLGGVLDFYVRA